MPSPPGDQTGKARFRNNWRGKLVLEIEYEISRDGAMGGRVLAWRDATERDLHRVRWMRKRHGLEPLI